MTGQQVVLEETGETFAEVTGQPVRAGDLLMTLEAMKMETAISSPRDALVEELVATTGQSVDAKDLLVVLRA